MARCPESVSCRKTQEHLEDYEPVTMTTNSHRLRALAHKHLTERDCSILKQAIQSFRETRSLVGLCKILQNILHTREQLVILAGIFPMIPADLQVDFDHLCRLHFDGYQSQIQPQITERGKGRKTALTDVFVEMGRQKRKSSKVPLPVEQLRAAMELEARHQAAVTGLHHRSKAVQGPSGRADIIRVRRDSSRSSEERKEHKRSRTMETDLRRSQNNHPVPSLALNSSSQPSQRISRDEATPLRALSSSNNAAPGANTAQPPTVQIRKIKLTHRENSSLGFSIRGGKDLNTGIYVSEVDAGGQAERHGLKVGERILKVNDVTFKNITHTQAVVALKSARRLTLYVAPVGVMPGSTPNSTPRSEQSSARSCDSRHQEDVDGSKVKRVKIIADEDGWLGCSIRGGIDYGVDVIVGNVDPMSPAHRAGLKKGWHINKVNGVSTETLTHEQIISLVTASNTVVLDIKPAPKKVVEAKNSKTKHRRSQTAEAVIETPTSERKLTPSLVTTQSPKHSGRMAPDFARFELELQSTPPVSTSTPLPPDHHPDLIVNRENHTHLVPILDNASQSSSPDPEGRLVTILHDSAELDTTVCSSAPNTPRESTKFDMGTIRFNLANHTHKSSQDSAKDMKDVLRCANRMPSKEHVKNVFQLTSNVDEYQTPVCSPKRDRNKNSILNTPEGNRYIRDHQNMLSSPYSNIEQEKRLANYRPSTPSNQLSIMRPIVNSQLDNELTGKKANKPPLCPNIPVAQTSPVSKFFKKMLRRNSDTGNQRAGRQRTGSLRSSSMESLTEDKFSLNSLGAMSVESYSIQHSAYEFMVENDPDVTLM